MIDRARFIGWNIPEVQVDVEKGQLAFFARAVGEEDPAYFDEDAARLAGHPCLPALPTFAFVLNTMAREKLGSAGNYLNLMEVNIGNVLHGEQSFEYFRDIYGGDRITLRGRIEDIYDKKNGEMEFIVIATDAVNQEGELCVRMLNNLIVRHPPVAARPEVPHGDEN